MVIKTAVTQYQEEFEPKKKSARCRHKGWLWTVKLDKHQAVPVERLNFRSLVAGEAHLV